MDNLKQTIEKLIEKRKYKIALAIIEKEDDFQSDLDLLQFAVESYINLGIIEKALELNKLSMILDPNSVISHIQLSNIYSLSKRQDEALTESKYAMFHRYKFFFSFIQLWLYAFEFRTINRIGKNSFSGYLYYSI